LTMALQSSDGTDGGSIIIVPDIAWIIERNNEIEQSNEQSQEGCTNEAEVSIDDDDVVDIGGENEAEVEQSNECEVTQSQSASNNAAIVDESENTFDITQNVVSDDDDSDSELVPCPPGQIPIPRILGGPACIDPNLTMNPSPDFP
jgi:hypothetical protein